MDSPQEYSCVLRGNIINKLNFLSSHTPDIKASVNAVGELCSVKPKVKRTTKIMDSPSWLRIRPVRRRSSKYMADDMDSDPDYEQESPGEEKVTIYYREPLENIERRLGIPRKPNQYGAIEGVAIGQWWKTRMECSFSGAHRPTVAGIHPGPDGAYSVALSGGYEGDWDLGNEFTFTGEGGRDLKGTKDKPKNLRTAPQSKDQTLTKGNLALYKSFENGSPVRVIRGYKVKGGFAPPDGYRYDGLYKVTKFWHATGDAGFLIYKYHFTRLENQLPLVDSIESILLFSSIKTKEVLSHGRPKRQRSTRRTSSLSFSADENSEGEDSESGLNKTTTDVEGEGECKDVIDQVTYIEIEESLPMFDKGRFLGFEDASLHSDDVIKVFEEALSFIEEKAFDIATSPVLVNKNIEIIGDEDDDVNDIGSFDEELSKNRRKRQVPRRVVRSSKS
ncbi:E3 ubiquitin-protein ligase UHRF1-like [Hetaerina americana]|uniref:E3 ubiquitin-protein ligase UHRF1-like n=1 Tax=Hetaerina americana TaxID=62018 RepID=UPI003A7F1622